MHEVVFAGSDRKSESDGPALWEMRPDQELLRLFVQERNGAAFAALVHRHGSMVLGVCRRVLRNAQDAEDAFQAAFMVLVHKASSMREPKLLASWLHGVALRTAQHARANSIRRSRHEREVANLSSVNSWESEDHWESLRERLDAELQALPEKYRAPLVLCYLEGKTHEQAARLLGWPSGSISARVTRGRDLLRERLAGGDRTLQACILPFLLGCSMEQLPLPSSLVQNTVAAALNVLPSSALVAAASASSAPALSANAWRIPVWVRHVITLKLIVTLLASLAVFSAVTYAVAGPRFFGLGEATKLGEGGRGSARFHTCD
jgi:RNA polymerase sigma factor (sigma-70 family)